MSQKLAVTETMEGDVHVLALVGRLDTLTAPQLDAETQRIIGTDPAPHIVVDMAECEYVSSAGLRVIVALQKRLSGAGSLRFRSVSTDVMDIFHATGFDSILKFA